MTFPSSFEMATTCSMSEMKLSPVDSFTSVKIVQTGEMHRLQPKQPNAITYKILPPTNMNRTADNRIVLFLIKS